MKQVLPICLLLAACGGGGSDAPDATATQIPSKTGSLSPGPTPAPVVAPGVPAPVAVVPAPVSAAPSPVSGEPNAPAPAPVGSPVAEPTPQPVQPVAGPVAAPSQPAPAAPAPSAPSAPVPVAQPAPTPAPVGWRPAAVPQSTDVRLDCVQIGQGGGYWKRRWAIQQIGPVFTVRTDFPRPGENIETIQWQAYPSGQELGQVRTRFVGQTTIGGTMILDTNQDSSVIGASYYHGAWDIQCLSPDVSPPAKGFATSDMACLAPRTSLPPAAHRYRADTYPIDYVEATGGTIDPNGWDRVVEITEGPQNQTVYAYHNKGWLYVIQNGTLVEYRRYENGQVGLPQCFVPGRAP